MAKYKVWLTVKDRYGSTKELDAGVVTVGITELTDTEVDVLDKHFATNEEVMTAVQTDDSLNYKGFFN